MASKSTNSTNLSPNIANALCYAPIIGWIAAIVFLIVEKNSSVKWNAVQSLLLNVLLFVVNFALGLTIVLALLTPIIWLAGLVLQLVLTVKAYQGSAIKLPLLSGWTDKVIRKV